jgi:hypothetical protein
MLGGYASFNGSGLSAGDAGPFLITGITTTTNTNDTLLLADPRSLISTASGLAVEAFTPVDPALPLTAFGHYEMLDDTPTLHALSGSTPIGLGWKPILLVP